MPDLLPLVTESMELDPVHRTVNASFFVLLSFKGHNLSFCPLKDTNFLCLSFLPKMGFRTIL